MDDTKLWITENTNTGARGDCFYVPLISPISNTPVNDSNCDTDKCFRSGLASGEPEQHQVCFSTSSATFIVSSSLPSEITIEQNDQSLQNSIKSNINRNLFTWNNQQEQFWFKEHWISLTILTGILMFFIIIITITIISH